MANKGTILFNGKDSNIKEQLSIRSSSSDKQFIKIIEGQQYDLTQEEIDQLPANSYTILVPVSSSNGTQSNPIYTKISDSTIIQPVDIQARLNTVIQTHTAIAASASTSYSNSTWLDLAGYYEVSITAYASGAGTFGINLLWSNDGTNQHGAETLLASTDTQQYKALNTKRKARYLKVQLVNGTTVQTLNAWIDATT